MAFDLFISHSRHDDLDGRVTQLIERLNHEFAKIHGRELKVFFDTADVRGWEDWANRILPALRESQLFLAFLSNSYLESDRCQWDLNEYLKREIARGLAGDGIVVVDAIDWTRWPKEGLNGTFVEGLRELRRRRSFDLRGELEKPESLHQLASQISRLIRLIERSEQSTGNIGRFNPHFTGRSSELEHIRESLALGKLCVLSGPAGIGKTSIATEYAHSAAGEYAGGCWQVSGHGRTNVPALSDLTKLYELRKHPSARAKQLLILDDVTESNLLRSIEPFVNEFANGLEVIATTRLSEPETPGDHDRTFLNIQGLPEPDAIQLIESFQPIWTDFIEPRAVEKLIATLVDGFPLAIEAAAAAARHSRTLSLEHFMEPLRKATSGNTSEDQGQLVTALLTRILSLLSDAEIAALRFTSQFDDAFDLSKIRWELALDYGELGLTNDKPGLPGKWQTLLNNLFSLRFWKATNDVAPDSELQTAQMHPLWRRSIQELVGPPRIEKRSKSITPPANPLDDNVMFTVYRRKTLAPNKWYTLLAFAHLSERRPDAPPDEPDPIVEVKQQAQAILGAAFAAFKQSTEDSSQPIPRSGELMFKPSVPGVEFNPPSRTFKWEEPVHREEFKMRASQELEGQVTRGCLRVFLGPIIVAEVNLAFKIDSTTGTADTSLDLIDNARPFRKVFASYSHKDTAIVEQIEKLVHDSHLGLEYLRDVTKLRSGEEWNESLLQMIDSADLFQLFWSTNSMRSEYVKREYERALARRLPGFVRPVYWEKPFPEHPEEGLPPEELKRLHFEKLGFGDVPPVPSSPEVPTRGTSFSRDEYYQDPGAARWRDAYREMERYREESEDSKREMEKRFRRIEEDVFNKEVESPSPGTSGARLAKEDRSDDYFYLPPASLPMSYESPGPIRRSAAPSLVVAFVTVVSLLATLLLLLLNALSIVHSWTAVVVPSVIFLLSLTVFIIQLIRDE